MANVTFNVEEIAATQIVAVARRNARNSISAPGWDILPARVRMALVAQDLCRHMTAAIEKSHGDYDEVVTIAAVIAEVMMNADELLDLWGWR